ncbi:MAG: 4Fe-4S binding protein [Oscillospiraceae bacterium]|nr:4Fe-4S binding protein [Oscillospiraceae bacterium]
MIYELLFSATGRTKKVLDIFGARWDENKVRIDLSDVNFDREKYNFTADDLVIVASSVFEGRIPAPAVDKLKKLKGNGAKAILLAVFGNRAVDDALLEMKDVMVSGGFVPVAAVESSVQHSIMPQVESSRPDADDKKEIEEFASRIKAVLAEKAEFKELAVPGNFPYVEMGGVPFKPKASKKCIDCGLCAKKCPTGAIPMDNFKITDKDKCITCMRCVEICPTDARDFPEILLKGAFMVMKAKFERRKPNKLYIAD